MLTQEMDTFIEWYEARVRRTTGRTPAPSTLRSKRSRLATAVNAAGLQGLVALATLAQDRDSLEVLYDKLALRMTTGSMRHVVDVLRDFMPYAIAQGWATGSAITAEDTPPSNPKKPITVYTVEEMDLLLAAARPRLRWWAFLTTLAETGRRVGEVLRLEWDWLRLDVEPPHFDLPYTKNKRQQYVPLSKTLVDGVFTIEHIEKLKADAGRLRGDPTAKPFPWTYSSVEKMFARHCALLDIEDRGFHNFRHTRATGLLAKGVPLQAVSALLGHASVQTTDRIYNHATALAYAQYVD